jgi:hypothetical protein
MNSDLTLIIGLIIILNISGVIGWWLSHRFYSKHYAEVLKASSDMLNIATETLNILNKRIPDNQEEKE